MKIKAAVFDIDGTLVPYGAPGPSPATAQALRALAQSGVSVMIATGRARCTAEWVLGTAVKPDYFAAVNGADVTDADTPFTATPTESAAPTPATRTPQTRC